jgi:hypothetical protein
MVQGAEAIVPDFLGREPFRFPRDADQLPRAERRHDHRAGFHRHPFRNAIIERAERGVKGYNSGAGERHAASPCGEAAS